MFNYVFLLKGTLPLCINPFTLGSCKNFCRSVLLFLDPNLHCFLYVLVTLFIVRHTCGRLPRDCKPLCLWYKSRTFWVMTFMQLLRVQLDVQVVLGFVLGLSWPIKILHTLCFPVFVGSVGLYSTSMRGVSHTITVSVCSSTSLPVSLVGLFP